MKRSICNILMTGFFAVSAFLFFFLAYPFHVCHQEQCQLFELTFRYLLTTLSVPGGLADYLGRFLTQYFVSAAFGSLILSMLLTGIQIATIWLCKTRSILVYALSFAAPVLLVLFFCDGDAMVSAPVAVLCSLLSAKGLLSIKPSFLRDILAVLFVVLLFWLFGSVSVIFIVAVLLHNRKLWLAAAMPIMFLSCPVIIHSLIGYPYFRLFYGINYYRFHQNYSFFIWFAVAAVAIVLCISQTLNDSKKWLPGTIVFIAVFSLGTTGVVFRYDKAKEEYMKYDILSSRFQWNDILREAKKDRPTISYSIAAVNLAIVKTGNLAHMFDYYQDGENGLLPEYKNDYMLAWTPSEAYFQLGMINDCQRHTFEAQELMPDAQKSARAYRRLAETNLINGQYNVARKYLRILTHTSVYRYWAKKMIKMIEAGDASKLDEGYEYLRSVRLKESDFLYNHNAMDAMLAYLVHENPSNHMALDYLLMWELLSCDLDGFMNVCPFSAYKVVPKPFQEAYMLASLQGGGSISDIPDFISPQTVNAFANFVEAQRKGSDIRLLSKQFGNTYWFYFFSRSER